MAQREAAVRSEFQEWYPTLAVGRWYPAAALRDTVLGQLASGEPRWKNEERVPCDAHFLFRGGDGRRSAPARTRHTDGG
jgi:hypothetical protein